MILQRVFLEHAIELELDRETGWRFASAPQAPAMTPEQAADTFGKRPILVEHLADYLSDPTWLLAPEGGSPALRISALDSGEIEHRCLNSVMAIKHVLGAVHYHCKSLAERYVKTCRDFARNLNAADGLRGSDRVIFANQCEPYYELEAFISAARRTYEASRHMLWIKYGRSEGVPRSFVRTLDACPAIPLPLEGQLRRSWNDVGALLTDYRDCIHHYVPLGRHLPYASMSRLPNGAWSMTCPIPDNPQSRSWGKFVFDKNVDALTYAWETMGAILNTMEAVIGSENTPPP